MEKLPFETLKTAIEVYRICINSKDPLAIAIISFLEELKTYREAEEQELLLKLPIAEGTQVFCIGSCGELCDDYETDCESCGEHQVVFCINFDRNMIEQFGETVFATEEEAEAILQMMQEGK